MEKDDNLFNYPSKEEYLREKYDIQERELHSDRFMNTIKFLEENYYNRVEDKLENKLFKIIGKYSLDDKTINMTNKQRQIYKLKKYLKLKKFISSLTEEEINSNIFLKSANIFMNEALSDCILFFDKLVKTFNDNPNTSINFSCDLSEELEEILPKTITDKVGIKYYRPQDYKTSYINILDNEHKYVYEDFNCYSKKVEKILEDVYALTMNAFCFISSNEIYMNSITTTLDPLNGNRKFILSFLTCEKLSSKLKNDVEEFLLKDKHFVLEKTKK